MTVKELKSEVYSLAGLPEAETDTLFTSTLRLALDKIRTELIITDEIRIYITPCRRSVSIPKFIHHSGENKSLPITGRAYSLGVSGKGYFTVKDGFNVLRYDFDTEYTRFRGFIKEGGEICFAGDYAYTVFDFVCFSDIPSNREEDIPDGVSERRIDLTKKGIIRPVTQPTDGCGEPIEGAHFLGDTLILPEYFEGTLRFEAVRLSRECSFDDDEVDIPYGYYALLPPLVASLLFIDDDRELAEKYEKVYENLKKELNSLSPTCSVTRVQTNGWA
jgi:hypothetical protein